jgi:hypothetical protein
MSRASFLDRSPEVSLLSAFAIWIRWWLKRKLKRNPLSFSAAVPCLRLALRSTSRRAIPVWSLSPAIVSHVRFQMNVPRGNRIHIETRADPRKATSTRVSLMAFRQQWRNNDAELGGLEADSFRRPSSFAFQMNVAVAHTPRVLIL